MDNRSNTQIEADLAALLNKIGNTAQIQQLQAQLAQANNALTAEQAAKAKLQGDLSTYMSLHTYADSQYVAIDAARKKAEADSQRLATDNQALNTEKLDLTKKVTIYQTFEADLNVKNSAGTPGAGTKSTP